MLGLVATPTNLTDRLSHLRDRSSSSAVLGGSPGEPVPPKQSGAQRLEKRPATDFFMIFVYALLFVALACQFFLILFLDLGHF